MQHIKFSWWLHGRSAMSGFPTYWTVLLSPLSGTVTGVVNIATTHMSQCSLFPQGKVLLGHIQIWNKFCSFSSWNISQYIYSFVNIAAVSCLCLRTSWHKCTIMHKCVMLLLSVTSIDSLHLSLFFFWVAVQLSKE